MINVYVGYDEREAVAYHVFCQSVLDKSSVPVSFTPLSLNTMKVLYKEVHTDGSNAFIYSRFLVPYLNNYKGWAIFADGDMVCNANIKELIDCADDSKAVMVVKHDYKTKHPVKYLGNKNDDYPRKNWSSVILFNCEHPKNKVLTPEFISQHDGKYLHRFSWLNDDDIGDLDKTWNWLALEYPTNETAKLIHYTIGTPCFTEYEWCDQSENWWYSFSDTIRPLSGN
jgi:lipopolysaccharide biosynthesis glycosyltransferase